MKNLKNMGLVLTSVACLSVSVSTVAGDDRDRYRCSGDGSRDISMDARYEVENNRRKFDASFEASPGTGFTEGSVLNVFVAGTHVGSMMLITQLNGDLEGDLEFDSNPDEGNPFPKHFPTKTGAGTSVIVGKIGCALDD